MPEKTLRVIVVDDHPIVRQGLRSVLAQAEDIAVVGEAGSAEEALRLLAETTPDVALVDIRLDGMTGAELCRRIREASPKTQVVILTSFLNESLVLDCLQAGARGYLLKDVKDLDLIESIRSVAKGEAAMSPKAQALLIDWVQHPPESPHLSREDLGLLRLIARGLSNREIAQELFLSESAVKERVLELFRKMGVKGRVEAVMEGVRRGLL